MATLPLPSKTVRLSSNGFNKLYAEVRNDPSAAKIIADFIQDDPRAALAHVFKLTKRQLDILEKTSDADLHKRAEPLLEALRADAPGVLRFDPHAERKAHETNGGGEHTETCTCAFVIPFRRKPRGARKSVA